MKFAVQFSNATLDLVQTKQVAIDCFKCPAWPDLVQLARGILPTYVHFPLRVGLGIGDAFDTETKQPADWGKIEKLFSQTDTPLINLHLSPTTLDFPKIPFDTLEQTEIDFLTEQLINDVTAVANRFGKKCVVVENDHDFFGANLRPAFLPQVIRRVIEETGCGFLLDLAHACLAANNLEMSKYEYISALPLNAIREIHISGIQLVKGHWSELFNGFDQVLAERVDDKLLEHLPMTDEDWELVEWSIQQIAIGAWRKPWVVAFEYGGVGPLWELVTDKDILQKQIPRLRDMVKDEASKTLLSQGQSLNHAT